MAVIGALVALMAIKLAIFPVPDAAKPIDGVVFVHVNTVPGTVPLKVTGAVGAPAHTAWLAGWFTFGVGLTVMVKVIDGPTQLVPPLVKVGVTVIVATTGALVALIAVNDNISPVPAAAKPMEAVLLVQLYVTVPPVFGLLKLTVAVGEPLHTTWLATAFIVGVGLTV